MPISKPTYNLLVFICQKPRTSEELNSFLGEKYCNNALYTELDSCGYWYLDSEFHISEKGRIAIEEYQRLNQVVEHSLATAVATSLGCLFTFLALIYQILINQNR